MEQVKAMKTLDDPTQSLGFIHEILSSVRSEIGSDTALIGFVGTPWTLAAYAMEGKAEKNCQATKVRAIANSASIAAYYSTSKPSKWGRLETYSPKLAQHPIEHLHKITTVSPLSIQTITFFMGVLNHDSEQQHAPK